METLEVHSKDFLIKWVNVPDNSIIDWQVKPLKKSINFSIYKKNEVLDENFEDKERFTFNGSNASSATVNSTNSLQPPSRNRSNSVSSVNKITESFYKTKSRSATLTSNINNGDLTLIKNYNKLISNELVHGKLEVSKAGVYAFIFDNSFSKTIGKKILFSSKIIEKETRSSHSPTTMPSIQATLTEASLDAVNTKLDRKLRINDPKETNIMRPKNGELLQSILLKKRRKKLQGFVKRYFVLNLKYGTLSYFRVNDSKLRGQMPITQSIISANVKRLEIIVDSGMEIWDLKALNKNDFDIWVDTFNSIKKSHFNDTDDKKEGFVDEESVGGSTVDELHAINRKINDLMETSQDQQTRAGLESLSSDVEKLIGRFSYNKSFDAFSVFSNNEFFDAKEILDGGVVELPDEDDYEDVFEEEDDSSLDSDDDDDDRNDLSIIKESDSVNEEVTKEVDEEDNDNNLSPLPLESVSRPNTIPEWTLPPTSILAFFRKNVGKDLTSISMPVDMNEPVTILQKYAELLEYCDLIDNALEIEDYQNSGEKILRIAAFAVSGLSSVREKERNVRKPFNPLLGETFELIREDKGIRLISEKVCHRPPVFATFVEAENWTLSFSLSPSQKFWGKTAEINNKGNLKLTIKSTGEVYTWQQPTSMLKNIIAGEKYTEPVGAMTIKSSKGDKAVVEFAKGGMFSGRSEELSIEAFDARKKKLTYSVFGKWTESLTLKTNTTEKLIWECGEMLPNAKKRFGFTKFASELVLVTDIEKDKLAPTDSRLRPDLKAYLKADIESAESLKNKLEEDQRTRRKENETAGKDHQPLFFHHVGQDSAPDSGEWVYTRGEKSYWNRRANSDWDDLLELW